MKELNIKANVETDSAESSIEKLANSINKLSDRLEGTFEETKKAAESSAKAVDENTKATKGLAKGFKGVGLALKAAGIGLLIGVLNQVKELFSQNQKVTDFFSKTFEGLSIVVNDFIELLTGGGAIKKIKELFSIFRKEGFSGLVDEVKEYGSAVIEAADSTVELRNQAVIAEAKQRRLIEQYDRQAEQLRQIRDNEEVSLEKRVAANEKLGQVLNEQAEAEQKLVDISVKAARAAVENNNSIENQAALIDTLAEKDAVLARIEGQRSEQLINQVSLRKELNEQIRIQNELESIEELDPIERRGPVDINNDPRVAQVKKANEVIIDENSKLNQALLKADKKAEDDKLALREANIKSAITLNQSLFQIAAQLGEDGAALAKGTAVAQAIFNTYQGINAALGQTTDVTPTQTLRFANAAAVGIAGFLNVKKILSTPTRGGSPSGGGANLPRSGGGQAPTPGRSAVPNIRELNEGLGGQEQSRFKPVQAYVVKEQFDREEKIQQRLDDLKKA